MKKQEELYFELENSVFDDNLEKFKDLQKEVLNEDYFIDLALKAFKVHAYSIFDYIIKEYNIYDNKNLHSGDFFNGVDCEDKNKGYSKTIYSKNFITEMLCNMNYVDADSVNAVKRALQVKNNSLELYRWYVVYYDYLKSENYNNKSTGKKGSRQFQRKGTIMVMCLDLITIFREKNFENLLMYENILVAIYDLLEYIVLNIKLSEDDVCEIHIHHNKSKDIDVCNKISIKDIINTLDKNIIENSILFGDENKYKGLNKRLANIIKNIKKLLRTLQH
ncbi:hypothetical protein [Clostridium botulinum]|uniref:hypothetical protein n=1 Tax=Clostridium botulinum TaxID=1491 RepID=UPI000774AB3F|nr:hypothetical protein [Clostridium botulinum]MBY6932206.1 hypothetical protein [Clostridium botulinum]NFG21655.1 hypothetical protein [Clostridium botulinum]NFG25130.1 hypothetical protein [Clostridium botulinum]NFO82279.1 hypothetical protein [Clostridium botulinum]NFR15789.1 hypothetical protein [Clostridium botulinum]